MGVNENTTSSSAALFIGNTTDEKLAGSTSYQGLVSPETLAYVYTITFYFMYPMCMVSFIFCVFATIVFSSKSMKSTTSVYLVALNLMEMFSFIALVITEITGLIYGNKASHSYTWLFIQTYIATYLGTCLRRMIYWITCLLSVERLIAVVFPLKSMYFKIVRYPVVAILCVAIVTIIFHVFIILKFEILSNQSKESNETLWVARLTELFKNNKSQIEAMSIASKVIFVMVPLLGSLFLNCIIAITLKRQTKIRRNMSDGSSTSARNKDQKTTILVLASTFALVSLSLPANVASIIRNASSLFSQEMMLYTLIMRMGMMCELLGNCTGFVFYITLSRQFRQRFFKIFCSCLTRKSIEK